MVSQELTDRTPEPAAGWLIASSTHFWLDEQKYLHPSLPAVSPGKAGVKNRCPAAGQVGAGWLKYVGHGRSLGPFWPGRDRAEGTGTGGFYRSGVSS